MRFHRNGAIKTLKRGIRWIGLSVVLGFASMGGWLLYNWSLNRPSEPVKVSITTVEKGNVDDFINESGIVELGGQQTLKSPVDGTVEKAPVDVGDSVTLGQTLVILQDPKRQTALAEQQLEIQKQQLKLERNRQIALEAVQKLATAEQKLQELATEEVEIQKLELQLARNREKVVEDTKKLEAAQQELTELEALNERGFVAANELQQQRNQVLLAQSQVQDAKLAVSTTELELQGLQKQRQDKRQELLEQVQLAQSELRDAESLVNTEKSELERLRLELKTIQQEIQKNLVKATINGRILDLKVQAGDVVQLGNPLLTLGNPSQQLVKIYLSPLDAVRVRVNQLARIQIIGSDTEPLTGRVHQVSRLAASPDDNNGEQSGQAVVMATVKLDEPNPMLIPGSKVDVEVIVAQKSDVVVLKRDMIQGSNSEAFVWVQDAQGNAQKRPVTLGLEGLTTVEVTSGLHSGDSIIVPPTQTPLEPGLPVIVEE